MGKILLTCEKPDAAKNIAEILGVPLKKINGAYYENEEYVVTWCIGHMINWKEPEEINPAWKVWSLQDLPLRFNREKDLKISKGMSKQVGVIKSLINRADVDLVVNAGDADREGLLIQEELYDFAKCKKPIKVLWSQSLTAKEIVKCMNNLKDREEFVPLLNAAKARSVIDNMMGKSDTRGLALTCCKGMGVVAYGRCQTPLLALLAQREREIQNFKVSDYYEIEASFSPNYKGILVDDKYENIRFLENQKANDYLNVIGKEGIIKKITKTKKKKSADKLFSLTTLQKEMGRKYHLSADKTLSIAQSLYEKKLTSYPRTDTEYINDEVLEEIDDRIKSARNLIKIDENVLNKDNLKKICKPNKVTGHHALLPTEIVCKKDQFACLSDMEKVVYLAICKRLLAIMMDDYEYFSIEILTDVNGNLFKTNGVEPINMGWKALYQNEKALEDEEKDENDDLLPSDIKEGQKVDVIDKKVLSKKTKAPDRYTTASIISLMEKNMIGRPATQADIIKKLIAREFIELKKNKYFVLDKGLKFIDLVLPELKDSELTKNIEEKLTAIADGNANYLDLIEDVYNNQKDRLLIYKEMAHNAPNNTSSGNDTEYVCPLCSEKIIEQKFSYSCSNNDCGFKINKVICEKEISKQNIKDLFTKGKCGVIKGFNSKAGKKFDASLQVDKDKKGVTFVFPKK